MSATTEYILKLRDEMSETLKKIKGETSGLNDKMKESRSNVGELIKGFLGFEGIMKGIEFGKEAFTAYNEMKVNSAQLDATLASTHDAIGRTREQLDAYAETMSKTSLNTKDSITSMQSVLATFTSIHGKTFDQSSDAVVNLAAKMHEDLQSAAVQVGKAIQDPIKGVVALRRVGVNFNQAQTDVIKNLVNTGHAAKAQQLILKELNNEFGGSAAAAAKANPWGVMMNQWHEKMEDFGELISKVMSKLAPLLTFIMDKFSQGIKYIEKNKELFKDIAIVIGVMAAAYGVYQLAILAAEAAQWLLNAATAANPIMIIVLGVGALVAGLVLAYKHSEKIREVFDFIWGVIQGVWEVISKVFGVIFDVIGATVKWVVHLKIVKDIFDAIYFVAKKIKEAWDWVADKVNKATDASVRYELKKQGYTDAQIDAAMKQNANKGDTTQAAAADSPGGAGGGVTSDTGTGVNEKMGSAGSGKEVKATNIVTNFNGTFFEMKVSNVKDNLEHIKGVLAEALVNVVQQSSNAAVR